MKKDLLRVLAISGSQPVNKLMTKANLGSKFTRNTLKKFSDTGIIKYGIHKTHKRGKMISITVKGLKFYKRLKQ